jgi:hypothetical protein
MACRGCAAELKVLAAEPGQLRLELVSAEGGVDSEAIAEDELEEITLQVALDKVAWRSIAAATLS